MMDDFQSRFEAFKNRVSRRKDYLLGNKDFVTRQEIKELMSYIDFESTMLRLGIDAKRSKPHEWRALCPDHVKYKGVPSSDPNWFINDETGLTYCFTEARGSNIVEVAKNIWGLSTEREAFNRLKDGMTLPIVLDSCKLSIEDNEETESDDERLKESLEEIEPILESCCLDDFAIDYFKKDGIEKLTLDKFGVVSASYGRYKSRVIIPFFEEGMRLTGYVAVDTLGKEAWAKEHARYRYGIDSSVPYEELVEMFKKKYRKALYAPGFQSRKHIYGFYENMDFLEKRQRQIVIVEGERDCLKLMQEGIPCVSIHGTSIKDEQLLKLKRSGVLSNLDEVYLGFDMDEAGNIATEKAFEVLSSEIDSNKIYVLNFPNSKETGEKRDPKKFTGDQIRWLMNFSRKNRVRKR